MRSLSVEVRITLLVFLLSLAAGIGGGRIVGRLFEVQVERAGIEALNSAATEFQSQEHSEIEKLSATLDALLANEEIAAAFQARDRARLAALCTPLFETIRARDRITHWYFIESPPAKTVFLRVHRPELFGDVVDRPTLATAIATGDMGAGKELGQTAFALRVTRPWIRHGKVIGYMELGEEIDHFLTAMKGRTGDEYGILVKKQYLDERAWSQILGARANTWNDRPDVVVVDTTIFNLGIADYQGDLTDIPEHGKELEEIVVDQRAWIRGIFPLKDAADRKVGGLFVLHDFTRSHEAVRSANLQTLLVMVALSILTAVVLSLALWWLVFRRVGRLAQQLEREADLARVSPERVVQLGAHDALARLEALFERLVDARGAHDAPGTSPRADPPARRP
ncbi:MAG TPA: cache domain-containing protein [Anaeromyxobacteraceae bacterium]|nr:cache domain-containing protein [Anaeromyxobacteraceae bacterium]